MKKNVHGEGNYKASRDFQEDQHEFAKSGDVKGKAREAADALDGPEGKELNEARKETAERGKD